MVISHCMDYSVVLRWEVHALSLMMGEFQHLAFCWVLIHNGIHLCCCMPHFRSTQETFTFISYVNLLIENNITVVS